MNVRKVLPHLLIFCLSGMTSKAQSSHQTLPIAAPVAPMTDQDVLLLFAGRSANDKILLTLNNNRPQTLEVSLTAYDLTGNPRVLPPLTMNASESRLIDFSGYLRGANEMAQLGFLKVHYSGRSMEVGAQLTLYPIEGHGGLDSPRSLTVDFLSTERHAVAWTPTGSTSTFSFTNVSNVAVATKITIDGKSEEVSIEPNETLLRTRDVIADAAALNLTDLDVSFTGQVDALRVYGYVSDPTSGPLPIRTYDPRASTTSTLSAVGLATKNLTHVVVRNLLTTPVLIKPSLVPVGLDRGTPTVLAPVLIPANTSLEVPVSPALQTLSVAGVKRATLFLRNEAAIGALIAAVDQQVAPGLIEDVPLKSSNPNRYMRGVYPLRWESDYTNRPMVANTSDETATLRAFVVAGGVTYTFPNTTLPAGQTVLFDVDAVRKNQTPDSQGKMIPLTATFGKFHWLPLPGTGPKVGLNGRTELQSLLAQRSSSFSCGNPCESQHWAYPFFDTDLFSPYPGDGVADARESTAHDAYTDIYGNTSQNAIRPGTLFPPLDTDDHSILNFRSANNDFTMVADAGSGGQTPYHYHLSEYDSYISSTDDGNPGTCTQQDNGYTESGTAVVQVPTATIFVYYDTPNHPNQCSAGQAGAAMVQARYIVDQYGSPIVANQTWTETLTVTPGQDGLFLNGNLAPSGPIAATNGTYRDQLDFCSTACVGDDSGSAYTLVTQGQTSILNQRTYTLVPNQFKYTCTKNTINGQ